MITFAWRCVVIYRPIFARQQIMQYILIRSSENACLCVYTPGNSGIRVQFIPAITADVNGNYRVCIWDTCVVDGCPGTRQP